MTTHGLPSDIVRYVEDYYEVNGEGPTRSDLAEFLGYTQTRNLPGVRSAINDGRVRYDGSLAGRLIPAWVDANRDSEAK